MAAGIRNRFEEVVKKQEAVGRVEKFSEKESHKLSESVNSEMREFRRDFQRKARESHDSSSSVILTS